MNKARRKSLASIIGRLEELKEELESITADLEELKDEEEECYDNIPENCQKTDEAMALYALETALNTLKKIDLDKVVDQITEAIDA